MAGKKSENKAVGISRGGRNTKIHALVDGLGNPLGFLLSSGSGHDSARQKVLCKKGQASVKGKEANQGVTQSGHGPA